MQKIAAATGFSREGLYQALSGKGNPSFGTILKVMNAVGVRLKPMSSAPVSPDAVTIKGQTYHRITLGAAYGWFDEHTEALIAETGMPKKPLPKKKSRHFVRDPITSEGVSMRAKRPARKQASR